VPALQAGLLLAAGMFCQSRLALPAGWLAPLLGCALAAAVLVPRVRSVALVAGLIGLGALRLAGAQAPTVPTTSSAGFDHPIALTGWVREVRVFTSGAARYLLDIERLQGQPLSPANRARVYLYAPDPQSGMGYGTTVRVTGWYTHHVTAASFFVAAVPNPVFDYAGYIAGLTGVSQARFLTATFAGKAVQSIVVALLGYYAFEQISRAW